MAAFFDDDNQETKQTSFGKPTKRPILPDGAHLACITGFEWKELSDNKGHAVVLTFSVLDPNETFIHKITSYLCIAHKTSTAAIEMAKKLTKELRAALEINEHIFDTDVGIAHSHLNKVLFKEVVIHTKGKTQEYTDFKTKEKKVTFGYNVNSFSPAKYYHMAWDVKPDAGKQEPVRTILNGVHRPQSDNSVPPSYIDDAPLDGLTPF
jgi:hypothetical protein